MKRALISGFGGIGPGGCGMDSLNQGLERGGILGIPEELPLKEGFPPSAMRWLDRSSLYFINAGRQALGQTGHPPPESGGVISGLGWGSNPPVHSLVESIHKGGYSSMNPASFPFSVGNAPAAQAGIHLGLKGPSVTVNAKEASGLAAIAEGCRMLATGHSRLFLTGAVDHLFPFLTKILKTYSGSGHPPFGEGAYALVLQDPELGCEKPIASVAAWFSMINPVAPHLYPDLESTLGRAGEAILERAGWKAGDVDLIALPEDTASIAAGSSRLKANLFPAAELMRFQHRVGYCGASWMAAAAMAAFKIRDGAAERAILLALSTGGSAYAIALTRAR